MHRDLKPQNVLITDSGEIKIADFGSSRAFGVPVKIQGGSVVTLWYRAPEILLGSHHYGCSIDIWSIGVIMAEILTGRLMFKADTEVEQLGEIFSVLGAPSSQSWPAAATLPNYPENMTSVTENRLSRNLGPDLPAGATDLLHNLLVLNPDDRMTTHEALSHYYFSDLSIA